MSRMARQSDGTYTVDGLKFETAEAACTFIENNPRAQPARSSAAPAPTRKGSLWLWVLGVPIGAFVLLLVIGSFANSTPEGRARSDSRMAIDLCWQEQQRPSLTPGDQRFIAGACEGMEQRFQQKYGHKP